MGIFKADLLTAASALYDISVDNIIDKNVAI